MIDVVYIKGTKSPNNDEELKFSLRSLKCVKDLGRVFITGECPIFIDRSKVIFTQEKDIGCKMINHWWKVTQTILKTDISENFVLMYDDIFFMKEVSLRDYPAYNRGLLKDHTTGTLLYRQNLFDTDKWLKENGYNTLDYELHIPFIYNRTKFLKLKPIMEKYIKKPKALAVRSLYGNINNLPSPYRKDLKLREKDCNIGDNECFSTSDNTFKNVYELLKSKYSEGCKYEYSMVFR